MKKILCILAYTSFLAAVARGQETWPVVKKTSVSVHAVERGSMPISQQARGSIISIQPGKAALRFDQKEGRCEAGHRANIVVGANARPLTGKVTGRTPAGACEVEFVDSLPAGAAVGDRVEALVVTHELKDVLYLGRPKQSQPDSTATIFLLDGASQARRVAVRYGAMSGPLIQVLEGLKPGDRVIVTDMSKWADHERVRLE